MTGGLEKIVMKYYEIQLRRIAGGAEDGEKDYSAPVLMIIKSDTYPSIEEIETQFINTIKSLNCDCVYGITPLEDWELEKYKKTYDNYPILKYIPNNFKYGIKISNSEEEKEMKILLKEDVKAKLNEISWSAYENEKYIDFSTCTAFGGEVDIVIDKGENLTDLTHNIYEYWNNYDVSYETSLWIGEDGHGAYGAPYDLKEIYEDMEGVKNMIEELYNIIKKEAKTEIQETSDNDYIKALSQLSAPQLKQIVDSYEVLLNHYKENFPGRKGATTIEEFETDLKPLSDFIEKIITNKHCPKCGELLLKSDLPQYNYVCPLCDENFYNCEVK